MTSGRRLAELEARRARAHRHSQPARRLQPRLRLLHRGQQGEPRPGAGRLPAQADAGRRRALHHAAPQGARGPDPRRARGHRRARGSRCSAASALSSRRLRGLQRVKAARRRSPSSTSSARLAEAAARQGYVRPAVDAGEAIEIRDGRHPVVERAPRRRPLRPQRHRRSTATTRRSSCSPAPTWPASRPTCARWR